MLVKGLMGKVDKILMLLVFDPRCDDDTDGKFSTFSYYTKYFNKDLKIQYFLHCLI